MSTQLDKAIEQINNSSCAKAIVEATALATEGVTPCSAIYQNNGCWNDMTDPTWEDALHTIYVKHRVGRVQHRAKEKGCAA